MNITQTANKSILAIALIGLCSTTGIHAAEKSFVEKVSPLLTKRNAIFAVVAAAVARVLIKYQPNNDRKSLSENAKGLLSNPLKKDFWANAWGIIDDNFIGHKGRLRGPRAYGSKVVIDGVQTPVAGQFYDQRGYKIDLVQYDHVSAYGLLGFLWSRLSMINSGLKPLKELRDSAKFAYDAYNWSADASSYFFADGTCPKGIPGIPEEDAAPAVAPAADA